LYGPGFDVVLVGLIIDEAMIAETCMEEWREISGAFSLYQLGIVVKPSV
jgi:hypothetical protein